MTVVLAGCAQEQPTNGRARPGSSAGTPATGGDKTSELPSLETLPLEQPDPERSIRASEQRISKARSAIENQPASIEARVYLAQQLHDSGEETQAETVYREVLDRVPKHVNSLAGLAQILLDRGEARQAEAAARLGDDASALLQAISSAGTVPQQ